MISVIIPVYRDASNAISLMNALTQQRLPDDCELEIIVVDDGSNDGTVEDLKENGRNAQIITLPKNRGRAIARNVGAQQAHGEVLAFIDCDCQPISSDFLIAHMRVLRNGYIASCGHVTAPGDSFWARYQKEASARRESQYKRGIPFSGSTQNFTVHKQAFARVGGFDTRYRKYGFEDRDLLLRLAEVGKIGWCADAEVLHFDKLTLQSVLAKMRLAGGESAALFSNSHPTAYRALGYGAIDSRLHHWLSPICMALDPLLRSAVTIERLINSSLVPYPVAKAIVKLLSALAFARGSAEGHR